MEELLNLIIETIENNVTLFSEINIGQLREDGGIFVEYVPGKTNRTDLIKHNESVLILLVSAKNRNQATALDSVDRIGRYLEQLQIYPQPSNDIELIDIEVGTRPQIVEKEENGMYIYSTLLSIKIYQ